MTMGMINSSGGFRPVQVPVEIGLRDAQVHDEKLERVAHLLRGQADPAGLMHCRNHLVCKGRQRGVECGDFLAFPAQNWIVVVNNSQGHRSVSFASMLTPIRPRKSILWTSR